MGDVSYRPLIEDMTWSYSRLSSFESCPYKWFQSYILDEEESPMFYASYGSFIHSLLEKYYSGKMTANELPTAFLLGFSAEVRGERPPQETVRKYIALGTEYFRDFRPLPFTIRSVEEELHFELCGSPFVAFLDVVGEKDGRLHRQENARRDHL